MPGWRVEAVRIKEAEVRGLLCSVCPGVVGGTALWLAGQREGSRALPTTREVVARAGVRGGWAQNASLRHQGEELA